MFVLKSTLKKLLAQKEQEHANEITRIQITYNLEEERQLKRISDLEGKIINAQEKNQQFFYKQEKALKEQVELGIIDHKEYHFSQRLLEEAEKSLK